MTTVDARPVSALAEPVSDPADFDATFAASYSRLVRTLTLVCGDAEAAADCVADAFERAYVRWRRVARLDDPVAWVRRVAINRARDLHRRETRGRRAVARVAGRIGEGTIPAPEPEDDGLGVAVAGLPRQQRTAVALHYLEDLSVNDVATVMGLSVGAVKFHLHQARERLRSTWISIDEDLP